MCIHKVSTHPRFRSLPSTGRTRCTSELLAEGMLAPPPRPLVSRRIERRWMTARAGDHQAELALKAHDIANPSACNLHIVPFFVSDAHDVITYPRRRGCSAAPPHRCAAAAATRGHVRAHRPSARGDGLRTGRATRGGRLDRRALL
eukprot:6187871-Pleurochrysis_carterae.AAC.1